MKALLRELRGNHYKTAVQFLGKLLGRRKLGTYDYVLTAPQNRKGALPCLARIIAANCDAVYLARGFAKPPSWSQHKRSGKERFNSPCFVRLTVAPGIFQYKKVLLLDDVATTGTTLLQCELLLREAGAEVETLALARRSWKIKSESKKPEEKSDEV